MLLLLLVAVDRLVGDELLVVEVCVGGGVLLLLLRIALTHKLLHVLLILVDVVLVLWVPTILPRILNILVLAAIVAIAAAATATLTIVIVGL